jgi:hypothetical protein
MKTILIKCTCFVGILFLSTGCLFPKEKWEKLESVTNSVELHTRISEVCGNKVDTRLVDWKDKDDGSIDITCKKGSVIFAWKIQYKGYLPLATNRQIEAYKGVKIDHGMAYYPRPMPFKNYMVSFYYKEVYFILYMQIPGEPNVRRDPERYFSEKDYVEKGLNLAKWVIDYLDREL